MNFSTVVGILLGTVLVLLSILLGRNSAPFVDWSAILIVVVALGLTLIKNPLERMFGAISAVRNAFFTRLPRPDGLIETIVNMARRARPENLLALEERQAPDRGSAAVLYAEAKPLPRESGAVSVWPGLALVVSLVILLAGIVPLAIVAFRVSLAWGLLLLLVLGASLVFVMTHWAECKRPLAVTLVGACLSCGFNTNPAGDHGPGLSALFKRAAPPALPGGEEKSGRPQVRNAAAQQVDGANREKNRLDALKPYIGRHVCIYTTGNWLYAGYLDSVEPHVVRLHYFDDGLPRNQVVGEIRIERVRVAPPGSAARKFAVGASGQAGDRRVSRRTTLPEPDPLPPNRAIHVGEYVCVKDSRGREHRGLVTKVDRFWLLLEPGGGAAVNPIQQSEIATVRPCGPEEAR